MPENSFSGDSKRLKEIAGVLRKHRVFMGLTPEKLRMIFEDLGPTFVKFGQIMSMRTDMLPQDYCRELGRLRAEVRPLSREEVARVLEKAYGRPPEEVFARFDWEPLGSASIAQVHRAELRSGEKVVVKVERPGIRAVMSRDVSLLHRVSGLLKIVGGTGSAIDFNLVIDEMWAAALQEMDFLNEADQAEQFARLNSCVAYVAVPRIFRDHSTSEVLVMQDMEGVPIDDTEELRARGYDLNEIGTKLAENYVKQIVDDGFFHADPHPGNLRVEGGKIVWLDMGMMGRLTARDRRIFSEALNAVVSGDVNELADLLLALGEHPPDVDRARLYADVDSMVSRYATLDVGSMDMAKIRDDILSLANRNSIAMPPGVSMLGRGLVTLEGVVSAVSPESNIFEIFLNHLSGEFLKNFNPADELKKGWYSVYRSGRRALNIPSQASELLKMGIRGQTKINVELTGSERPLRAVEKMVNRVALAVVEAGLLMASAMLGASGLPPRFFGIPLPSAVGLALAVLLGGWLLWDMLRHRA